MIIGILVFYIVTTLIVLVIGGYQVIIDKIIDRVYEAAIFYADECVYNILYTECVSVNDESDIQNLADKIYLIIIDKLYLDCMIKTNDVKKFITYKELHFKNEIYNMIVEINNHNANHICFVNRDLDYMN